MNKNRRTDRKKLHAEPAELKRDLGGSKDLEKAT